MPNRRVVSCVVLTLVGFLSVPSAGFEGGNHANTWYVAVDGDDAASGSPAQPFATIQFAVDAAASGDTVLVADGTYLGVGNRDVTFRGKDLVLRSQSGNPESCTIDCEGGPGDDHRGFIFESTETGRAVLSGFTIRGGHVADQGGGILCRHSGIDTLPAPRIENCVVMSNQASAGGGLAVVGEAVPRLVNCRFVANTGGGAYWGCASPSWCTPGASLVEACRFQGNTGHGIEVGGSGLAPFNRDLRFRRCIIAHNTGQGVLHDNPYGYVDLDSCEIRDNGTWGVTLPINGQLTRASRREGERWGSGLADCLITGNGIGGVYSASEDNRLVDCIISDNHGPGIRLSNGSFWPAVVGCTVERNSSYGVLVAGIEIEFRDNVVRDNGAHGVRINWSGDNPLEVAANTISGNGGAGLRLVLTSDDGAPVDVLCRDNVVVANGASGVSLEGDPFGGPVALVGNTIAANALHGIACVTDAELQLAGTVVAFNQGEAVAGAYAAGTDLHCVDLFGNALGDYTGDLAAWLDVQGNFTADPLFCDLATGDPGLRPNSPCAPGNHPHGDDCGRIGAREVGCPFDAIPYIETFDDGAADGFEVISGEWAIIDGQYVCHNSEAGQRHVATAGESTWSDYRCEGDILVAGAPEHEVLFRYQSPDDWYLLSVLPSPDDRAVLYKSVAGVALVLAQVELPPRAPGIWRHLAVEVQGPAIRVYDDGALVLCHEDAEQPLLTGKVGLSAYANPAVGWQNVYVDNVSIQNLDVETRVPDDVTPAAGLWSFPNPFNPRTRLAFRLAAAGRVSLAVYDLQGRRVRTLLDEALPAGEYDVEWNGRDGSGRAVPAGTYFGRLTTPAGVQTRKMNLVK